MPRAAAGLLAIAQAALLGAAATVLLLLPKPTHADYAAAQTRLRRIAPGIVAFTLAAAAGALGFHWAGPAVAAAADGTVMALQLRHR